MEYYLPLYFQSAKQASPLRSGLLLLPIIITEAFTATAAGIIIHQVGRYLELIWVGTTLLTIGIGTYIHLNATSSVGTIIGFEILAGLGAGLLFDPPLIALQALVSQENTATATATFGFVNNIGISIAIVMGGVIFQNGMHLQKPNLQDHGLPRDLVEDLSGAEAAININLIAKISDPVQSLAVKQAFAWSLRNFWIMCTCMAACGLIASTLIRREVLTKEHTETQTGIKEKIDIVPVLHDGQDVARAA